MEEDIDALRVGVVGGGLIAQAIHLPTLRALDDRFRLSALADASPRVRDRLCARYAIPRAHADHRALLAAGGLDAIVVCSPNGTHARVVLDALDAGLHVFVEKPLCIDPGDAARIDEAARRAGRVAQVGYMKRFDPAFEALVAAPPREIRHVRATTVDPAIGRLLAPPGFVVASDVPEAERRRAAAATAEQVARAVGADDPRHVGPFSEAFLGALVHDVNLVRGLLDAAGVPGHAAIDGFAAADGTLAGGTFVAGTARCAVTWALAPLASVFTETIEVLSDEGVAALAFPAPYLRGAAATSAPAPAARYGDAFARELEHFHACATRGIACRTPPAQARGDIQLLASLYGFVVGERAPGVPEAA